MSKFLFCACMLALALRAKSQSGQELDLIMFDDTNSDPLALCNDGTRGGYYFGKALDPAQSNVFVVHLPGGGQCYDKPSCDGRAKNLMSSKYFTPSIYVQGLLDKDPAKTPLWGANKVQLGYCSSDGYMGDAPASEETWGYHFRGQRLVHSMFQALILNHNFNNATAVYFTGCSAGARGMMVHSDQLVDLYVPEQAKKNVLSYLDSPYYLDVIPYSPNFQGFQYQEQQKYKYYNTQAILSDDCVAAYPSTEDQWKCQYGQFRMPFVRTPYFIVASQYDSYQLEGNTQTEPALYTSDTTAYAESFAATDRSSLTALSETVGGSTSTVGAASSAVATTAVPVQAKENAFLRNRNAPADLAFTAHLGSPFSPPAATAAAASEGTYVGGYGYFSWACYNHAVATSDLFYTIGTSDGVSQKSAFEAYLAAGPVTGVNNASWTIKWMDSCTTFGCGTHCNGL